MTQPAVTTDEQLSGRAADAVADIHSELRRRYSDLNDAEAQLAEALLTAQTTSEAGRARLQSIQRQLIEAINNPVNALDTPAGERQFLIFLRGKVAEIHRVVDHGDLTAQDQAELTRALANGYLSDGPSPGSDPVPVAGRAPQTAQAAPTVGTGSLPATMGALPQATPAALPASALGTLGSPLAGLLPLLSAHEGEDAVGAAPNSASHEPDDARFTTTDDKERDPTDDEADDEAPGVTPEDAGPEDAGPAQTRPAAG
jgi:Domain of unknown function (DUF4226)